MFDGVALAQCRRLRARGPTPRRAFPGDSPATHQKPLGEEIS